ncbi:MAG: hypothetical protein KJP18_11110, partial [Gemmatimonadetes bacterium]|nr:hypothetical protein [Gemmatimonadota bacterium]
LQKDGATMNVIATEVRALRAGSHSGLDDPELQPALPETLEYWAAGARHLTALRQNSPGSKSWG